MAEPNQKPNQHHKKPISPYVKAIAGSVGGVVEACCLQPIDVIKTRLQLDRSGTYQGIIHCGATVVRTEGVRALWKGLTPFATHLTLKYALRMGSNAVLQAAFRDPETGKLSNRGRLLAGFRAGVIEALVIVTQFENSLGRKRHRILQVLLQVRPPYSCGVTPVEAHLEACQRSVIPIRNGGENKTAAAERIEY